MMRGVLTALVEAINSPSRAAPLWGLAYIKYPGREIQPHTLSDGIIQFTLKKRGFEYKAKSPRPTNPPPVDCASIQEALNTALPDGLTVTVVQDYRTYLKITLEVSCNV